MGFHAQMLCDPGINAAQFVQFFDDITLQIHIVGSLCPIVPDGACHPVGQGLVNDCDRHHVLLAFINIGIFLHHAPTVEAVNNRVDILFLE